MEMSDKNETESTEEQDDKMEDPTLELEYGTPGQDNLIVDKMDSLPIPITLASFKRLAILCKSGRAQKLFKIIRG